MSAGFEWTDAQVRTALGLAPAPSGAPGADLRYTGVSTDTRTLGPGALFVALVGARSDGHDFLSAAAERGALGAVVSRGPTRVPGLLLYRVDDTLEAWGALGRHRRRALPARVVGLTGSAGKTTVKDLLGAALDVRGRVHATRKNENNRVGVPKTLLEAPADTAFVVLEMGTSEPGEIAILTAVSEPDAAVLTTVSESHLEGLGSLEGVLDEKLALVRGTRAGGPVIVGDDPSFLPAAARAVRPDVHVAGLSPAADAPFRGRLGPAPDAEGRYEVTIDGVRMRAPSPGRHGAMNAVLAFAMARELGVEAEPAARAIEGARTGAMRGELRRTGGPLLLVDCYNANPQSTRAALALLAEMPSTGPRIAILGSMLELGARSEALHREVLEAARALPLDRILAIGAFAAAAKVLATGAGDGSGATPDGSPPIDPVEDPEAAYRALRRTLEGSETILLKGSRGVALERLVDRFEADFGTAPDRAGGEG